MNNIYLALRVTLIIGCITLLASCNNSFDESNCISHTLSFVISEKDRPDSRSLIDNTTMRTQFEIGDKAGVFAVYNGQIVEGFNNLELTYNANGMWEPSQPIVYNEEIASLIYYAYFPYDANFVFDAGSDKPFATAVANYEFIRDQSSREQFNQADLMLTAECFVDKDFHCITLPMEHVGALVTVELPNSSYIFDNDNPAIDPYVMAKAENVNFLVDRENVSPYFDSETQSYRLILKPGHSTQMKINYTNNGRTQSVDIQELSQINEGEYANFIVDGGAQLHKMLLQVGDYFLSDGNIVSKETKLTVEQKNKIIGVVYKLGTTDAIEKANRNWTHAMVIGLTSKSSKWGNSGSPTSEQNNAGWKTWYTSFGLSDLGTTDAKNINLDLLTATGYESTLAWRKVTEPLAIGGYELDYTSVFNSIYDSQQNDVPTPLASTSWFLPSVRDWMDVQEAGSDVTTSINNVSGKELIFPASKPGYWTTDLRSGSSGWCYTGIVSDNKIYARGYKDTGTYRWILAF